MGTNIKKRTFWAQKTSWGKSLSIKKRIFGPKIGKKFEIKVQKLSNFKEKENKVQKLSNFKEKKDFLGQKNKLGLSLRTKNGLFWAKILIKIESKGQKLIQKKKKKKKLGRKKKKKKKKKKS